MLKFWNSKNSLVFIQYWFLLLVWINFFSVPSFNVVAQTVCRQKNFQCRNLNFFHLFFQFNIWFFFKKMYFNDHWIIPTFYYFLDSHGLFFRARSNAIVLTFWIRWYSKNTSRLFDLNHCFYAFVFVTVICYQAINYKAAK